MISLLILAALATTARVLALVGLSVVSGWLLCYVTVKNRVAENVFVSIVEVLESVPVISFFPIVLLIFVQKIGGPLGVELAVDFLVFTAVVWNIWMGIYQAYKTLPREMVEVVENYGYGILGKLRKVYIPFSMPRVVANLFPSVADAFFYITVSEVFSVGTTTYATFGIGTVVDSLLSSGQYSQVELAILIIAILVAIITVSLRALSRYVVAKYALDTDIPIRRRGRTRLRYSVKLSVLTSTNPLVRIAKYSRNLGARVIPRAEISKKTTSRLYTYVGAGVSLAVLGYLIYGAASLVLSVPDPLWFRLFSVTPTILLDLAYDYLRVAIIALLSFAIAVFLGYYLAANDKADRFLVPVIQALLAIPAPLYFPLLVGFSLPFLLHSLGWIAGELYVLTLGFISAFYYILFSFWIGVKSIPVEYWELSRNLRMGFWTKMRRMVLPSTFPYMVAGLSSTINSIWGGLTIAEYWPHIVDNYTLSVHHGLMAFLDLQTSQGNIAYSAWGSFIFGIVVVIFSIFFTRRLLDLARKRYVMEEGIYAA